MGQDQILSRSVMEVTVPAQLCGHETEQRERTMGLEGRRGAVKRGLALAAGAIVAFWLLAGASATAAPGTVKLEGYVWGAKLERFSITSHRGGGAVVSIAEYPELTTTAAEDGYWTLQVPDRASVTPCAELEGHHSMCDQTFFTRGQNLNQVNFQMVVYDIASILGTLSGGEMKNLPNGRQGVRHCAIVSTFFEKEKRSFFDFQDYLEAMPHGVAGATATATLANGQVPAQPIYFNEYVMPDRSFSASSRDGGVMWVDLPPGVYTITSSHPTARFAPFQATCEEGRLINANPPWGLYEMARTEEPNPAVLPPDRDESVSGSVLSARVTRSGKSRILRVKVKAEEKLEVLVEARQGKRRAARRASLAVGRRTISIKLNRNFKAGSIRTKTTLINEAGNRMTTVADLNVPKTGRRK